MGERAMTVEQLIRELRRFPKDAIVGIQDHDAGEHELSARVCGVYAFNPDECEMAGSDRVIPDPKWASGVGVVIRGG